MKGIHLVRSTETKRFSIDVLWNIGSLIILAAGGVGINSLIVALQGEAALGVFNQVYAFYIVLSQLGVGGLQFSVLKQVSYAQDDLVTCADTTSVALVLILAITIPIALAGVLLADSIGRLLQSPDVAAGLVYTMPGLVLFAMNKVLINVLNGLRRMRVYAAFRALRFVLIPAFILGIIALDAPANSLPLALTLTELALLVALGVYIYGKLLPLRVPAHFSSYARSHISYGLRGLLSGVLIELNTRVDVLILGIFLSDRIVGVYSYAAILAEGFAQIPVAVRYNVDPLLGTYFASQQLDRITRLARRIRRVFLPGMALFGILGILFYPLVYGLLAGSDGLLESWIVFVILAVTQIGVAGYSPMQGILLQGGIPGAYTLVIMVMAANNIVLNILLIPPLGIYGSALATSGSIVLQMALIVYLAHRLLKVRF